MDPQNPPQILVHFYRTAVQHADVWRRRLDVTTNWAVVSTAAIITFSLGHKESPHFVVLVTLVFDFIFLFMETRRYQMYHLWRRRIRLLHRFLIAPALRGFVQGKAEQVDPRLEEVATDLGRTVPAISLAGALGYRIRRNYGPLVTVVIFSWLLKLYIHPRVVAHLPEFIQRATVGLIPGKWILISVGLFFATCIYLAIRAPSEQMNAWQELPAPIDRIPGIKLPGAEKRTIGPDLEPENSKRAEPESKKKHPHNSR